MPSRVSRMRKRYRAPEGEITERKPEHFIGYVVDFDDDPDDSPGRVRIDKDELPGNPDGKQIAAKARELGKMNHRERPQMRRDASQGKPENPGQFKLPSPENGAG